MSQAIEQEDLQDMPDSTVTLGDVEFDPVAIQDFRLSIEGTSGTGKSNTLAVLLEDLADVPLPTLIIERLGALTPVRLEDDDILVVGARDEEGIDIPVALGDLDTVGGWVLDRGLKILIDISTYADYEDEKSREHLAAAKAIRSLNDRAHEKYRAGDRSKSLLIVDEAHILAPKDSAPEPELDDHVKRCRGQLIKASTEGGNKGISIVVGYQRRAFLHNGVIQLAQDFVNEDAVQDAISEAKDKSNASPRYVKGVVAAILEEGGPVDYETVADLLGVKDTSNVSKAASTLEALGVLERVQQSPARIDFDLDGVAKIKEKQMRRNQAEAVMEDL